MRNIVLLFSLILSGLALAGEIPTNPDTIMPPAPSSPQGQLPMTFTDDQTSSYPASDMDTMQTQTTGTYNDEHPTSRPIPLEK